MHKEYYYHSDHLGSASLISDYKGDEYQRIEYAPYGETWVEKTQNQGLEYLPYRFTGKEMDEETGLYYYGARYLDPKTSRWLSTDPAVSDYISGNSTSGGLYNTVNFNLYHYAGNNPIVYTDPDGRDDRRKSSPDDLVTSMIEPHEFYSLDTDSVKNTIFSNIMRESVGAKYSHDRPPTSEKMDCSGAFVYALQKMGYDMPDNLTADDMATGKFESIKITDKVDNSKQGEKGYLNFYKWGTSKFQHVNYGVGRKGNETEKQVVDASAQGTSWETNRNGQRQMQKPAAIPGKINKTWAPFSNRHTPDRQAIIDWSKLKRKVNDDE